MEKKSLCRDWMSGGNTGNKAQGYWVNKKKTLTNEGLEEGQSGSWVMEQKVGEIKKKQVGKPGVQTFNL